MAEHKYGRGKYDADEKYINYMEMIVNHPNYSGMPNARSGDGRINWQVSSGKTTSFYKFYLQRRDWWIKKADSLGLAGKNDENDRFTKAARIIHPTGYRTCRLCGEDFNVGYFYLNSNFSRWLNKNFPPISAVKGHAIDEVLNQLKNEVSHEILNELFFGKFPERSDYFIKFGITKQAFEASRHIRTYLLSPGFMGNPPDRLDGFHDYHGSCRKAYDPGRFDENMRSYNHDRRSFEWWAEGNWALADALYNKVGAGSCSIPGCGTVLDRVSPDHIGPLACGFKQLPLFAPTCQTHNSAKNRRFTYHDVVALRAYEKSTNQSVASWQVRAHWDKYKVIVSSDNQTKALSNSLRSLQDMYLRVLWNLYKAGQGRFLAGLLHPEYALLDFEFKDLDPGKLTFSEVIVTKRVTKLRRNFAARTVRIAFEALAEYAAKPFLRRKMVRSDYEDNFEIIKLAVDQISSINYKEDKAWTNALCASIDPSKRERMIEELFVLDKVPTKTSDENSKALLQSLFDGIGSGAGIDFSRYDQLLAEV